MDNKMVGCFALIGVIVVAFVILSFFWGAVVAGGPIVVGVLMVACYLLGATVGRS